ncbi:MAG TPA: TIGR03618 family F420-dependent PPOX class oxidoreductase [Dehalococcoidia bacterium]|nr:TIGR03618 family F420-dependent PPOX class oxidoreductase [Dehalococcoidia bacterium]
MTPEERREFLRRHRLAIVGAVRADGRPQLSPVYYAMDGDDLLISTAATRAKAKAVRRDGRVTVCVIGEQAPFPYLTVYGRGRIEEDGAVDVMMSVGGKMAGAPLPESAVRPWIHAPDASGASS